MIPLISFLVLFWPQAMVAEQVVPSPSVTLSGARQLVSEGNFKDAEAAIRAAIVDDPKSPQAAFLLGYVLLRLNRPKESLAEYTRGAALQSPAPPAAEDLRRVADDYVLLNDMEDADKWMRLSVEEDPKDIESWYGLGRIRYTEQRFADAAGYFEKALTLAPKSVKVADNLGLAYDALNRRSEAIAEWKNALQWQAASLKPSEQPMLNLASVYVEQGQVDDALPLLSRAATIAPRNSKIHEQLGHLFLQKNQLPQAQREFEAAIELQPDSGAYHFLLGQVLKREGSTDRAKAEFERAAALNGTHSTVEGSFGKP